MLRLCLDSAGDTALLVLAERAKLLGYSEIAPARGADRVAAFLDGLDGLLAVYGGKLSDLEAVFVVEGPGRYTGIRLGLSLAHGLVLGTNTPLYGMRRDQAYRALMTTPHGLILCDSGKAVAYGGVWQDGVVSAICFLEDEAAVSLLDSLRAPNTKNSISVLGLLPEKAMLRHYLHLGRLGVPIMTPDTEECAEALLCAACLFDERPVQDVVAEQSVQAQYRRAAL
ncbi:MAG: hypothetical protein HRT36_08515 [Alphaproteobacteria bacterium]|nr:hypothetical protein [Alphaproteobacteria bacterium]